MTLTNWRGFYNTQLIAVTNQTNHFKRMGGIKLGDWTRGQMEQQKKMYS